MALNSYHTPYNDCTQNVKSQRLILAGFFRLFSSIVFLAFLEQAWLGGDSLPLLFLGECNSFIAVKIVVLS